jgi:glycosyltransferase involved in cell wall biosynthesis
MNTLTIITVSRSVDNCRALLDSLPAALDGVPYDVIVSWNGPPEHLGLIAALGPHVRGFDIRPYNFARNNNAAAREAAGSVLAFVNDDIIADPGSLRAAALCFEHESIGIVGGRLRYPDGRLQHAGVHFKEDGTPFHIDKLTNLHDARPHVVSKFVPAVTGALFLMRRDEFAALQFDETYEVAGEDIDLCLRYRAQFSREIYYCAEATAIHRENVTRKEFGQTKTPDASLQRIRSRASDKLRQPKRIRVAIRTEKPGWIMHRQATEVARNLAHLDISINSPMANPDIAYYINYGYFERRHGKEVVIANFTHYDPSHLAEKFESVARECDHCVAVSNSTSRQLRALGVEARRISVIENGADSNFEPRAVLGVCGRVYEGGRKGEAFVEKLACDPEVTRHARIVANSDNWGVPVWRFEDPSDFYHAIDLLLITSSLEGGPVPFFEALACGKLAIAPEIGAVPDYPHLTYAVGDYTSLRSAVLSAAIEIADRRRVLSRHMFGKDWYSWAHRHELAFREALAMRGTQS